MQVYGAVAWSTDIASSGTGCLPGSSVVPQTLWTWSAAGAQGNWHLLPGPGVLLWHSRDSSPHLAAAQYTKLTSSAKDKNLRAFKAKGVSFPVIETVKSTFGCLFLFVTSGDKLTFYFRWGSQTLGGLGLKNFLTSGQGLFLISFCCSYLQHSFSLKKKKKKKSLSS